MNTNLDKYWRYRTRLRSNFTVIGTGHGESLVAGIRNLHGRTSRILHYGDQTIYLGWYIGVLATEYDLLRKGRDADTLQRTMTELHYALNALDRLDEFGNAASPWNATPQLDGFFIRDDVQGIFASVHFDSLNNERGEMAQVEDIISDYADPNNKLAKEMSQDQAYHLLMGLALAAKFAEDIAQNVRDLDGKFFTTNFAERARNAADRIIRHIRGRAPGAWIIRNPRGSNVSRGELATPMSFGLARAGRAITGNDYGNIISSSMQLLWLSLQSPTNVAARNSDNVHMALVLAAVGNSWSGESIRTLGSLHGWETFYDLLRAVLHATDPLVSASQVEEQLNAAPPDGPFYFAQDDKASGGWASSHRFYHDRNAQDNGSGDFKGYYNGLDYMLLYNLHCVAQGTRQ